MSQLTLMRISRARAAVKPILVWPNAALNRKYLAGPSEYSSHP
jgi:hypothetical protein